MKKKSCGRKRKRDPVDARRFNWIHPLVFQQIDNAAREVGPQMSPLAIVNLLRHRNPQQFFRLTPQVLGRWIERTKHGAPRWKDKVLGRVQMGNKPHGLVTRSGILVRTSRYTLLLHVLIHRCRISPFTQKLSKRSLNISSTCVRLASPSTSTQPVPLSSHLFNITLPNSFRRRSVPTNDHSFAPRLSLGG